MKFIVHINTTVLYHVQFVKLRREEWAGHFAEWIYPEYKDKS
jgi:hypothetical protein